ncbi:YfcE family phosphodiesterase [Verrucomicrobium sp. BvORR106]|uniref:YfcE family phosphodiesterase n=1 Tax=Verrucomicrobium sp. BvORR106 TaxID=1403819 RepID=UPI00057069B5|nr:YfcE family phosphodiesterase [Verrucomicrobium sp. BvORR106]
MKIAVLSDIHDHLHHLTAATRQVGELKAEALLFLGDFCAPFTLAQLAESFSGPIHVVFGNNDGDQFLLSRVAGKHSHVTLHGLLAELELDGKRIALNHYPDISRRLAESGAYDAVFSGHDHQRYIHQIGKTLWANPGELMGRFGSPGFGLYDTGSGQFSHVDLVL